MTDFQVLLMLLAKARKCFDVRFAAQVNEIWIVDFCFRFDSEGNVKEIED